MKGATKHLSIDEEGYVIFGEARVTDPSVGHSLLKNIHVSKSGAYFTVLNDERILVEAFDEPYIAQFILTQQNHIGWKIMLPYGLEVKFNPSTLTVDEWDRFHGHTSSNIPFVLSRKAQIDFFNQLDEYDDDSITHSGCKFFVNPWSEPELQLPKTESSAPTPALVDMLPRLKIPKSKVLVLNCGTGHDAAYLAQQGHFVTAVDLSSKDISRAKTLYGKNQNLHFVTADIFNLPPDLSSDFGNQFDLIFTNVDYHHLHSTKRNKLVKIWRHALVEQGHLLAVVFGGTEWDLRERLKKFFQFIFWGRWRNSFGADEGKELLIYAIKKS